MAGFPKFPIPRYLNTGLWLLNRNWKNNLRHTFPPTFLLVFLIYRTVSLTVVIKRNFQKKNNIDFLIFSEYHT